MEDAKALNCRGWEQLCQGRRHEALDDFSRAIELDPNLAEAYNNRSIARRIADEDAAEDEDWADALTMHDLEAQMRLRQQRKWMCIGYSARGEPEGEKHATDADFLISFASPDREENNRILHELKTRVCYNGSLRFLLSYMYVGIVGIGPAGSFPSLLLVLLTNALHPLQFAFSYGTKRFLKCLND